MKRYVVKYHAGEIVERSVELSAVSPRVAADAAFLLVTGRRAKSIRKFGRSKSQTNFCFEVIFEQDGELAVTFFYVTQLDE